MRQRAGFLTDVDCYLMCDDKPVEALCLQNLCQQNSCLEFNPFPYQAEPITFSLELDISGTNGLELQNANDFFVQFTGREVQIFSSRLPLAVVLEKSGMQFVNQCLIINGTEYCTNEQNRLELWVNEEQSFSYGSYVPRQGDKIKLRYVPIN